MIRHIVFFSARSPADHDEVYAGLKLLESNPHAELIEVTRNLKLDALDDTVDFVVYGEFANEAALAAYKAHPIYQASIDRVRHRREIRIAADVVAKPGNGS